MRFLCVWLSLLGAAVSASALEAGAAKVDITPPLGTPLNGYGDRMSRGATGIHDPLTARCLYLSDGETSLFLVTTDLCILNRELREAVLERAPDVVPPEHIILTATHTHNGTGGLVPSLLWRSISGRFVPESLAATADGIAQAMAAAYEARERATLGFGTGKQNALSTNRAFDDGPIDEQIGVIRVDDADGVPIAIVGNFAAHPTTVSDADRYVFSADYCGFFYNELEALAGEGCVALFMNGAEGDQRTANPEEAQSPWERTESVGRLLAGRVKEIANGIKCDEVSLRIASAQATLPPTIASQWMPSDVFLQTLEINDALLLTFVPGEPCVDIGLELRKKALSAGYKAQFTVGLANDHLLYFVPRRYYTEPIYETGMNVFGPGIATWFTDEFARLMSRAPTAVEPKQPEPAVIDDSGRVVRVVLSGDPYAIGFQRGAAFESEIRTAFTQYVSEPMTERTWLANESGWQRWPSFIDVSTVAIPMLAIGIRPGLKSVGDSVFTELEGMADGANMAFDAVWLTQTAQTLGARGDVGPAMTLPFCTVFTARDNVTSAPFVGRTFDWPYPERPMVFEVRPKSGRAFLEVGFAWSAGAFTGVNDAGVAIAVERIAALGAPNLLGPYVEFLARRILETAATRAEALAQLEAEADIRGYTVTVADGVGAEVVTYGETLQIRALEGKTLLAADTGNVNVDDDTIARYSRAAYLLADVPEVNEENLAAILADTNGANAGRGAILNDDTRYAAVINPADRAIFVSVPDGEGSLMTGQAFRLAPGPTAPATAADQP